MLKAISMGEINISTLLISGFGIVSTAILGWLATVSLQFHLFKKEIYFEKKKKAFEMLQIIDWLKFNLFSSVSKNDFKIILSEDYNRKVNEFNNLSNIYFPDFFPTCKELITVHKNSEKLFSMYSFCYNDGYSVEINEHNKKIIKNINDVAEKYEKYLNDFKDDFLNYLGKEKSKLWFRL